MLCILVHLCYHFTLDQQRTSEASLPGERSSSSNAPAYTQSEGSNQHTHEWVDPGPTALPVHNIDPLQGGCPAAYAVPPPPHQHLMLCSAISVKELSRTVRNSPFEDAANNFTR